MSTTTVDTVAVKITASSTTAAKAITNLTSSLTTLKSATASGISGLSGVSASLSVLGSSTTTLANNASGIRSAVNSLKSLSEIGNFGDTAAGLASLNTGISGLQSVSGVLSSVKEFSSAMTTLKTAINKLMNLDMEGVADKMDVIVAALTPLTDEMIRGGSASGTYGTQVKDLATGLKTLNSSATSAKTSATNVNSLTTSFKNMLSITGIAAFVATMKQAFNVLGDFVTSAMDYIEAMNLFTVAMGDGVDAATEFVDKLQELLGIDASAAAESMGIFNNLLTSFGVAAEQAELMSQTFTQLIYDYSSFYNLATDEASTKLLSGLSGEIEPLRQLGIDLSEARLQLELYALGYDETYSSLTQADKATLRYIATLNQSTNSMGDLSRTLNFQGAAV